MDTLADNTGDSWYSQVADLFKTGSEIYGNVKKANTTATPTPAATTKPNWYLIGGIGAGVLVLLLVVMGRK